MGGKRVGEFAVIPDAVIGKEGVPIVTECRDDCRRPIGMRWHCAVCHQTFAVGADLDRHRRDGRCLDPASMGLHTDERGAWGHPQDDRGAARGTENATDATERSSGTPVTKRPSQGLYGAYRP